jgi:hypothetical protein
MANSKEEIDDKIESTCDFYKLFEHSGGVCLMPLRTKAKHELNKNCSDRDMI